MLNLYRIVLRGTRQGDKKDCVYMQSFLLNIFHFSFFKICVYAVDSAGGTVNILRHSQILADSSNANVPRRWATFKKDAIRFSATVPSVTGISTKRTSLVSAGVVGTGPVDEAEGVNVEREEVSSSERVVSILLELYKYLLLCFYIVFYGFMLSTFPPDILTDSPSVFFSANICITPVGEFLFIRLPFSTGFVEINIGFHSLCSTSRKHL